MDRTILEETALDRDFGSVQSFRDQFAKAAARRFGSGWAWLVLDGGTLKITDTPPAMKGATATNQAKKATLETGLVVNVPPFIESGEVIRVDTRSGEYLERVK